MGGYINPFLHTERGQPGFLVNRSVLCCFLRNLFARFPLSVAFYPHPISLAVICYVCCDVLSVPVRPFRPFDPSSGVPLFVLHVVSPHLLHNLYIRIHIHIRVYVYVHLYLGVRIRRRDGY